MKPMIVIGVMFVVLLGMNVGFFVFAMNNPDPVVEVEGHAR